MTTRLIEALYRTKFEFFVRFALGELRPNDAFLPNWHIDLLTDRMKRILANKPTRLVVNMPPRHLKSIICSLALPAFMIGNDPTKQIVIIVGSDALAQEFHAKLVKLMGGKRYRSLFPHTRMRWSKRSVNLSHGGFIRIATVGTGLSGRGADLIIIDDPISPSHAKDSRKCQAVNNWYRQEVNSRVNDKKSWSILLVMQRVNGDDLSAYVLQSDASFEHLVLPAVAVASEIWTLDDGRVFERQPGELLHPDRADMNELLCTLDRMNGVDFSLQYLQGMYMPRVYVGKEHYHEFLWMPRPDSWKAPAPIPEGGHLVVYSKEYVLRDVFRISPPEPILVEEMPITEEEFEICAIEHQRLLVEEGKPYFGIENPDTTHPFHIRRSLFGRKMKSIFQAAHENRYERPNASG